MTIRILVVDDESHARMRISSKLKTLFPLSARVPPRPEGRGLSVFDEELEIREARNGREAIEILAEFKPDIMFLDIEMPEISGFDVIHHLGSKSDRPQIIFQTAYDQFAIKAFEINACDYLLKPFTDERLKKSLSRALEELIQVKATDKPSAPDSTDTLNNLNKLDKFLVEEKVYLRKFVITAGSKSRIISEDQVIYFWSEHHGTRIFLKDLDFAYDFPLNYLQTKLDPSKFFRLHRNSIIRLDQVVSFTHDQKMKVSLANGKVLRASRSAGKTLKKVLANPT